MHWLGSSEDSMAEDITLAGQVARERSLQSDGSQRVQKGKSCFFCSIFLIRINWALQELLNSFKDVTSVPDLQPSESTASYSQHMWTKLPALDELRTYPVHSMARKGPGSFSWIKHIPVSCSKIMRSVFSLAAFISQGEIWSLEFSFP